jgi:hypothetical protein
LRAILRLRGVHVISKLDHLTRTVSSTVAEPPPSPSEGVDGGSAYGGC